MSDYDRIYLDLYYYLIGNGMDTDEARCIAQDITEDSLLTDEEPYEILEALGY